MREIIKKIICIIKRKSWIKKIKENLKNTDFTLISNNCIAGIIYNDLGLQFRTPTVNLYISGEEYLNFVKNFKIYISSPMFDVTEMEKKGFPVGKIIPHDFQYPPIKVYFQHYQKFEDAFETWRRRSERINYENIYFLWEFFDELYDVSLLKEFDELPIKKMALLHNEIAGIENGFVFKYKKSVAGDVLQLVEREGKRHLDEFDYVRFLNN